MLTVILILLLFAALWLPLFRYLVPRLYLVMGDSMCPTLSEGDVVMGFKPRPDAPLKDSAIYGYRLPWDKNKWVIKRLMHQVGDKCFFQGDNPGNSVDSRDYGLVDRTNVMFEAAWLIDLQGKGV